MSLRLGVSTWSFSGLAADGSRGLLDGGRPYSPEHAPAVRDHFSGLVEAILQSEIAAVELWHSGALHDEAVLKDLQRLAEAGRVASMHAPSGDLSALSEDVRQEGIGACRSAVHLLSRLGGRTLVVHASSRVSELSEMPERVAKSASSIAQIADACADPGVQVAVELLAGQTVGSSGPELLALLELIGRPNVGICIDVNHVFPAERLVSTVYCLAEHLVTLHIADYDGSVEKHWLPTRGVIDWPRLVRALGEIGYSGPFVYEVRLEAPGIREAVSIIEENYRELMESAAA